jgi:hypothetical protein
MSKSYTFQILPDNVTERELEAEHNWFNMKHKYPEIKNMDQCFELTNKILSGDSIEVADSSIWRGLENEDSLRAVMYDAFGLWDDDDLLASYLKITNDIPTTRKTVIITKEKIDYFEALYNKLEKNPNWGDEPIASKEQVLAWLRSNIGKKLFITC